MHCVVFITPVFYTICKGKNIFLNTQNIRVERHIWQIYTMMFSSVFVSGLRQLGIRYDANNTYLFVFECAF
ncbi:hypothetical protein HMPREF9151_01364 [Hoylesella saccharolytica F0055]|uniref:Uncharacterized protein n=1 Tax=Hoylesella saccharolytica F0055 TaxID=1127699 RepID=L1N9D7_9BACT|nr:hypothetical protein HMPREF9151_01364 [Hoylesella saccharolytica F0055]